MASRVQGTGTGWWAGSICWLDLVSTVFGPEGQALKLKGPKRSTFKLSSFKDNLIILCEDLVVTAEMTWSLLS